MRERRTGGSRRTRWPLVVLLTVGTVVALAFAFVLGGTLARQSRPAGFTPVAVPSVPSNARAVTPRAQATPSAVVAGTPSPNVSSGRLITGAMQSVVQIRTEESLGTGFVVQRSGGVTLVVTNAHVVGDVGQVAVIATDGSEHPGQVIVEDAAVDLAMVEVPDLPDVPALSLGDSETLEPGDSLYVIGFALGTELLGDPTLTRGVMSGRRMLSQIDYIQTDAAMNPGNSGGPVLNEAGQVVGVATATIRGSDGEPIEGINFAIPVEAVRDVIGRAVS